TSQSLHSSPTRRSSDLAVLRRWGVTDCERVDRRALTRSLTRLQHDEAAPAPDLSRLIRHIRARYHRTLIEVIGDAVSLATACERSEEHTSELQSRENLV